MGYIKTGDGIDLYYRDGGAGRPVVLVHGWCISGESWEYVMTDLIERGFRGIAYDLRGCGRSDQPWNGYDYDTLADDLATVLETLGLRDVTLVGHSMAGGIITRYLANHGAARVARAVLIGTTTPFPLRTDDNPDGVDGAYFDQMIAEIRRDRPHYVASLAPAFFGGATGADAVSPALIQWGIDLTLQASARAAIELLRTNARSDQREELKQIAVPTLLLHGDQDGSCPLALTACRTRDLLPDCRLTVYEGKAHGIYITDAARVSADIAAFIDSGAAV
jgi:pimeloyl-ACP methyl ester carboxylesterase